MVLVGNYNNTGDFTHLYFVFYLFATSIRLSADIDIDHTAVPFRRVVQVRDVALFSADPYPNYTSNESLIKGVLEGYSMPKPALCPQTFFQHVISPCLQLSWRQRPTFQELLDQIAKHETPQESLQPLEQQHQQEEERAVHRPQQSSNQYGVSREVATLQQNL